jgi:hypothetical protein
MTNTFTCLELSVWLDEAKNNYDEMCSRFPNEKERWLFDYLSFQLMMIRQIHRYEIIGCDAELAQMETAIDNNRDFFFSSKYIQDIQIKWANKYVNIGANFNNNFLFCVTTRCNKNCKYCMIFCPYLNAESKHYEPSFEELAHEIDGLFKIIDTTSGVQFGGGEPCTRKDLPSLIDYVGHYKERISDYTHLGTGFGIITNSSIPFNEDLIQASKRFGPKLVWLLDDYHFSRGVEIASQLEQHGINYVLRDQKTEGKIHCGGWLNIFNDYTKPTNKQNAISNYSSCGQAQDIFQFAIAKDNIYPCSRIMAIDIYWAGLDLAKDYYVPLYSDSVTREEKQRKLKELLCNNHYFSCGLCGGIRQGRKRYYPAEQLNSQELSMVKTGKLHFTDFSNDSELESL